MGKRCLQVCFGVKDRNQIPMSLTHRSAFVRSGELCLPPPTHLKKWDKGLQEITHRKVPNFLPPTPTPYFSSFLSSETPNLLTGTEKMPVHHHHDF